MTKKEYELIAQALKNSLPMSLLITDESIWQARINTWKCTVKIMANELENNNPRFNRSKFLQTCGYND